MKHTLYKLNFQAAAFKVWLSSISYIARSLQLDWLSVTLHLHGVQSFKEIFGKSAIFFETKCMWKIKFQLTRKETQLVLRNTSPYLLVETEELVYTVESLGETSGLRTSWASFGKGKTRIAHLNHHYICPQWLSLVEPLGYSSASLSWTCGTLSRLLQAFFRLFSNLWNHFWIDKFFIIFTGMNLWDGEEIIATADFSFSECISFPESMWRQVLFQIT